LVMKESLLHRFDALDVRVRKVLQTCAVLGNSFALPDLFQVHPDIQEMEIKMSLDIATEEMILLEIVEEEDDNNKSHKSGYSNSTGGSESRFGSSIE
jgi:predicted ATPase